MNESLDSDRLAWLAIGFGLIVAWWLPILSPPILTFYKEWLFVIALGIGGLSLAPVFDRQTLPRRQPLVLAIAAILVALVAQCLAMDGVWRKATLTAGGVGFFFFTILLGRSMQHRKGDESMPWVASCLVVAAIGSCLFAALQLSWVTLPFPLVIGRAGDRLSGNLGQANHFADLLWIGSVSAVLLFARRKLTLPVAALAVVALQVFSVLSGSRMVWLYIAILAPIGVWCWRRPQPEMHRFGAGLVALGVLYPVIAAALSVSGALDQFGVTSAERRASGDNGAQSTTQRLWLWHAGVDAAIQHPLLGVGAGQYPGHALDLAMREPESPANAADANAHNLFIHLAAELGIPLGLLVAACVLWWFVSAWRHSSQNINGIAALGMFSLILIHANLEHPLWYLYFLGLLGLLVGHLPDAATAVANLDTRRNSPHFLRFASIAVLVLAVVAYVQFGRLERAMQVVLAQVRAGAPPQLSGVLVEKLAAIPSWSPYGDYSEAITLIAALPTKSNAGELMARCERALTIGPIAHLLARCATAFEVGGQNERATHFANSVCKLYPGSEGVLIQSMMFVRQVSPAAGNLRCSCVEHVQ